MADRPPAVSSEDVFQIVLGAVIFAAFPAFIFCGFPGLLGLGLGFAASATNLVGWVLTGRVVGEAMRSGASVSGGTSFLLLLFFVKLPLLFVAGFLAQSVGQGAVGCFLVGLGLVYFGFVGWSLVQR